MRQRAPPRVKGVLRRVPVEVRDLGRVDVGEPKQPSAEEGRVLVRAEDGAKVRVAPTLQVFADVVQLALPRGNDRLIVGALAVLVVVHQMLQCGAPDDAPLVLLRVL